MKPAPNSRNLSSLSSLFPCTGLLLLAALAGCEQQHADLRSYIADTHQRQMSAIDPLPEFSEYAAQSYQGHLKRDPFAPTVKSDERGINTAQGSGPRPDVSRPKEHLENFPLDGIRIVGMMDYDNTRYALLRTNEPTLYRTTLGNYIGQNHGKVVAVTDSGLIIRELIPDGNGRWQERTQELTVESN